MMHFIFIVNHKCRISVFNLLLLAKGKFTKELRYLLVGANCTEEGTLEVCPDVLISSWDHEEDVFIMINVRTCVIKVRDAIVFILRASLPRLTSKKCTFLSSIIILASPMFPT